MRAARAAFRNRRLWAGVALGGALAAVVVLVWNRASHEGEANARVSEPAPSKPIEAPTAARKLDAGAAPAESSAAPQAGFTRYEDYFRNYYATYSYASPAYVPADWGRGTPAAPPSAFTLPSIADLLEPAKLLPNAPPAVPLTAAIPDVAGLTPAATVSMPPPSSPTGLLTNNTPFHLFVTSDPVSAAASTASEAPSVAPSGAGGVSGGGGVVSTATGTAGSLLHK